MTKVADAEDALFLFQAINSSHVLKKSWVNLMFDSDVFKRNDKTGLAVRHALDAVVDGESLFLNSDYTVRRFLDMTRCFQEATDPEVKAFLDHKRFHTDDLDAALKAADNTWVRRKITSIRANADVMSMSVDDLVKVAKKEYKLKLVTKTVDGSLRLVFPSDKDQLKVLLHFLDEDYLDSQLTNSRFEVEGDKRKIAQ